MVRKKVILKSRGTRRRYTDDFKAEAVQMLMDGHTAPSGMTRLGLPNTNLLYRWKQEQSGKPCSQFIEKIGGGTHSARVSICEASPNRLQGFLHFPPVSQRGFGRQFGFAISESLIKIFRKLVSSEVAGGFMIALLIGLLRVAANGM